MTRKTYLFAAAALMAALPIASRAAVVINEFEYDESGGSDDHEFVELYNAGATAVDISGWKVQNTGAGSFTTLTWNIPASTSIPAGGYYTLGSSNIAGINQPIGTTLIIGDGLNALELRDAASAVVDAVSYETNKDQTTISTYGQISSQLGNGIYSNFQTNRNPANNNIGFASLGRFVDGRDTDSNGRDFGMRPATPGASNNSGIVARYLAPNVDALADGASAPGLVGSFVGGRAITPGVVTAYNKNAIPAAPGFAKAIVAWDESGGGNGVTSAVVGGAGGGFRIQAYLDTNDTPEQSNTAGTKFRGSEETMFGFGSADALNNLADISGQVGIPDSANGSTGILWYYEKVGLTTANPTVSEKLYLIDANDGGDSGVGGTRAVDWTVLATIDLSSTASAWHTLGVDVDALGNGVATYDDQTFNFTTIANMTGAFYADYRENLQEGSVTVPAYARPATFAPVVVPEPTSVALLGLGALGLLARRRAVR